MILSTIGPFTPLCITVSLLGSRWRLNKLQIAKWIVAAETVTCPSEGHDATNPAI